MPKRELGSLKEMYFIGYYDYVVINDDLESCFLKIKNLIEAEISDRSKDYDVNFIRNHVEKLTN